MNTIKLLSGSIIAMAAVAAQSAFAQDANLAVTASVTKNCEVEANALAFGGVNVTANQNTDAEGNFNVTCTNGVEWTARAGLGNGADATFASRKMTFGAELMDYSLYTDADRTTVWDDGSLGEIKGTGTGFPVPTTIYGRIPADQRGLIAGDYADTVVITVSY